jgi:hypothetical protein
VLNYLSTLTWRRMREEDVQIHVFLTSALIGGELSASCPCRCTPPGKEHRYQLYRRWAGHQSRSARYTKVKNSSLYRDSNSDPSVVQIVASRYTDCAIAAPKYIYNSPWRHHSNFTWRRVQVMKLLFMQPSPHLMSLHLSSVQIFSSAICSQKTPGSRSFLSVREQVSLSFKTRLQICSSRELDLKFCTHFQHSHVCYMAGLSLRPSLNHLSNIIVPKRDLQNVTGYS